MAITRRGLAALLGIAPIPPLAKGAPVGNGWSNQAVRRLVVEVGSDFSGIFLYDPGPGAGNLVGSWAVAAGTDPYGNAYVAGIQLFNKPTGLSTFLLTVGLAFSEPGWIARSIVSAGSIGSGTSQVSALQLTPGNTGGGSGGLTLFSRSADGVTSLSHTQSVQDNGTTQITGDLIQNDSTAGTAPKFLHTGRYSATVAGGAGAATFNHGCSFTPTFGLFTPTGNFSQGNWTDAFGTHGFNATQAQLTAYAQGGAAIGNGVAVTFYAMFMA
jgi:hypothetical protein